jgi:hypothetical protein
MGYASFVGQRGITLNRAVAGLEMAHLPKITSSFEMSALSDECAA